MSANGKSSFGNSKRRKLTPFLCQEMLFDYALGLLDADRKAAVENFLKTDQECREILENVRAALAYTEALGRVSLRSDVISHLHETENAASLGRKYASWKTWPESLRWSVVALVVSSLAAGVIGAVPWHHFSKWKFSRRSEVLELADLSRRAEREHEVAAEAVADSGEGAADEIEQGSGDEEVDVASVPGEVVPAKSIDQKVVDQWRPSGASPTPAASATPVPAVAAVATPAPTPERKEAKPKGFVYRAFMNLGDLDEVGPKIADHIIELGGEKAGEVELGWKRGAGRYYHFSFPEENEEKLLEKLRAYGPVRISKDPHARVMPPGQVRFILWVEPLNSR